MYQVSFVWPLSAWHGPIIFFLRGEMHVWGGFSASLVTVTMKQPSCDSWGSREVGGGGGGGGGGGEANLQCHIMITL